MDFFIKDKEGVERGPVSQDTLLKWVSAGKVRPETLVRNSLLKTWKVAGDFPVLEEPLKNQPDEPEDHPGFWGETGELLGAISGKSKKKKKEESTAFEYKHLPAPATVPQRIASFVFDFVLLSVFGTMLYFTGVHFIFNNAVAPAPDEDRPIAEKASAQVENAPDTEAKKDEPPKNNPEAETPPNQKQDESKGYKPGSKWTDNSNHVTYICLDGTKDAAVWVSSKVINNIFHRHFIIFLAIALLYYGLALGYFAQTFGMWFWGIFIAKNDEELSEVFFFRAYMFAALMFIFGILSPVLVALNPKRRALHDILTGVRALKIAGKPKA